MFDIAVSYARSERAIALDIVARLRADGHQVWIDDSSQIGDELANVGVPAGQEHWKVIRDSIDSSGTLLILDSEGWRASEYCNREYDRARETGTRVAVLWIGGGPAPGGGPLSTWLVGDLGELSARLGEHRDAVVAHTELLTSGTDGLKFWHRRALGLQKAVTTLEQADLASVGIALPEELKSTVARVRDADRRRSVFTRSIAIAFVVSVIAGTVGSVVLRQRAEEEKSTAEGLRAMAESRSLSQLALDASLTPEALAFAEAANDASESEEAQVALATVRGRARAVKTIDIGLPIDFYMASAVSRDGSRFYVLEYSQTPRAVLSVHDSETGELIGDQIDAGPSLTSGPDRNSLAVTVSTERAAFVDNRGTLIAFDLSVGSSRTVDLSGEVNDVVAWGNRLIVALADGRVVEVNENFTDQPLVTLDASATALTVSFDDELMILDEDGIVHRLEPTESGYDVTVVHWFENADSRPDSSVRQHDRLRVCGDTVAALRDDGLWWRSGDDSGRALTSASRLASRLRVQSAMACGLDAMIVRSPRTAAKSFPEDRPLPLQLERGLPFVPPAMATSAAGDHLVSIGQDGIVHVVALANTDIEISAPGAVVPVETSSDLAWIDSEGRQGGPGGAVVTEPIVPPPLLYAATVNERRAIATEAGWTVIGLDGTQHTFEQGPRGRLRSADELGAFVAVDEDEVVLLQIGEPPQRLEVPDLRDDEILVAAVPAPIGGHVVSTSMGRVVQIDDEGAAVRVASFGGGELVIERLPRAGSDARFVTFGSDGVVRLLDEQFGVVDTVIVGGAGADVRLSPDGGLILALTSSSDSAIINVKTLQVVGSIPRVEVGIFTFDFTASGTSVLGVRVSGGTETIERRAVEWDTGVGG